MSQSSRKEVLCNLRPSFTQLEPEVGLQNWQPKLDQIRKLEVGKKPEGQMELREQY